MKGGEKCIPIVFVSINFFTETSNITDLDFDQDFTYIAVVFFANTTFMRNQYRTLSENNF